MLVPGAVRGAVAAATAGLGSQLRLARTRRSCATGSERRWPLSWRRRPSVANSREKPGVRILYISPLKALNQDVWRNLQFPLEGILAKSEAIDDPLPALRVAVRSGDTPSQERARLVRKPPDILIGRTLESLHLMHQRARATARARRT